MASTASAALSIALQIGQTKTLTGFNAAGANQNIGTTYTLANASTVRVWYETRELAASGTQDYDLAGVLADMFGDTVTYSALTLVMVIRTANADASTAGSSVTLSDAPANGVEPFTGGAEAYGEDGFIVIGRPTTGTTITGGSADSVRVTNNDGSNKSTYTIVFVGTGS